MDQISRKLLSLRILVMLLGLLVFYSTNSISKLTPRLAVAQTFQDSGATTKEDSPPSPPKSVRGLMQVRPGGPLEEVEVAVHAVPVDVPSIDAKDAAINDKDLVLGVVISGQAMAYPIRYLAMHEIVDDQVGDVPLAPSW